jgi:hypothetical protein
MIMTKNETLKMRSAWVPTSGEKNVNVETELGAGGWMDYICYTLINGSRTGPNDRELSLTRKQYVRKKRCLPARSLRESTATMTEPK